jgi:hypothetical protein
MRVSDFAKMLSDSIHDEINQSRGEMHETHNPIFNQSLLIEIQATKWMHLMILNWSSPFSSQITTI